MPTAAYLSEVESKVEGKKKLDIRMMIFLVVMGLVVGFVFQMTGRLIISGARLVDSLQGKGNYMGYSVVER